MKLRVLRFVLLALIVESGCVQTVLGQTLLIKSSEEDREILKIYSFEDKHTDSLSATYALQGLVRSLQKDGYFAINASPLIQIDSSHWQSSIRLGKQYQWAYLDPANLDPWMQERSGFREKFFLHKPFSHQELEEMMERILREAENTGFPFANIKLTKIKIQEEDVHATLHYESGPYITFGDLQISGTDKVKADFLASYLKIPAGSAYSEKKVRQIAQTLRTLPYVEMTVPLALSFQNDEAEVHLSLADRKVNQMDGLVNLLPNENGEGSLLLTGSLEILLNNLMKSGKQLSLQWQRLQVESQQLSIGYQHPYLFRSPYQAGFAFHLLREDTLFINRSLAFNLSYALPQASLLGFQLDFRNSSTLSEVSSLADYSEMGGALGDFSLLNLSTYLQFHRLNDILLPTKGWDLNISLGVGRKRISSSSVEADEALSWQPFTQIAWQQYQTLGKLWVLYFRLSGAYLSGESLYLNDLYRLGGLRSLRGFNDNFFYASYYGMSNLELRLLLEQSTQAQSYLYVFYDQAVLGHRLESNYQEVPLGVGLGLSMSTDIGLFNLAYAIGKLNDAPMDFSLSKIHFGYIGRF